MLIYISVNLVNIVYIKVKSRFVIISKTLQAFLELFARSHGLYFRYKNNNHHLLMLVLY